MHESAVSAGYIVFSVGIWQRMMKYLCVYRYGNLSEMRETSNLL